MVQYLPSTSNQITVTVQSLQVNTTLTLTGPTEATQGQVFTLTATLKRGDTNAPIPGAQIAFERHTPTGGTLIGIVATNGLGVATLDTSMDEAGVYNYVAIFQGLEVAGLSYRPSLARYTVGGVNIVPLLAALGVGYLVLRGR